MKKSILAALAFVCAFATAPARAQSDQTGDDIHCFLLMTVMTTSSEPEMKNAGAISAMYWLGRLDGHVPKDQVEKLVQARAADLNTMSKETVAREVKRCSDIMIERTGAMVRMSEVLSKTEGSAAPNAKPAPNTKPAKP